MARLLAILLMTFSSMSFAAIYKCEDANGKIVFTDQQCSDPSSKEEIIEVAEPAITALGNGTNSKNGDDNANASSECQTTANKVDSIIKDWHKFITSKNAQSKNSSVMAMYRDHQSGTLKQNFARKCQSGWARHSEVFECLAGASSGWDGQMCTHSNYNTSGWRY